MWAFERKVVVSKYISGGNLDDLQNAEKDVHTLLAKVSDALFRMGAGSSRGPHQASRARYSAETGVVVVTCQIGCDLIGGRPVATSKVRDALPANFSVIVR